MSYRILTDNQVENLTYLIKESLRLSNLDKGKRSTEDLLGILSMQIAITNRLLILQIAALDTTQAEISRVTQAGRGEVWMDIKSISSTLRLVLEEIRSRLR